MPANCSVSPTSTPSDAGIAGPGVLLSFIITATVALVLSCSLVVHDVLVGRQAKAGEGTGEKAGGQAGSAGSLLATIGRKLLSGYSDQQIMTGIGVQSVGLAQASSLVPYHFFLVWMLGLLSTAVHNAALVALVHDFRRDWVLRWLRQALMLVNLGLSCAGGVYLLRVLARGLPATLAMACAWEDSTAGRTSTATGLQYVATVAVIVGNCAVFGLATWYLYSRAQRFYRAVQLGGLVLMAAVAVGATTRVLLLAQALGGRPSVTLADDGERQWTFGQVLSLLMLVLPLVSAAEIARGEIMVAPPRRDDGEVEPEAGLPLVGAGDVSLQP